jgi:flavin reductase (DIM6/NTAB) family NADH-FMN oxidoreductase RutF
MSARIDIGPQGFLLPMPMTLIGADLPSGPNFMPVAWINRVQYNPPRVAAGMLLIFAGDHVDRLFADVLRLV